MSARQDLPSAAATRTRLSSLTSLRFFAAFIVFLNHFGFIVAFSQASFRKDYASVIHNTGLLGVSFFFVLSGFVLAWSARAADTTGLFWRRRVFKIFPLHLVMFAAVLIEYTWFATAVSDVSWTGKILNLFMVQTWWPRTNFMVLVNIPSWTLSCELFFYLAFPLAFRWIKKIRPEHLWGWAAGVTGAILLVPLIAQALPAKPVMTLVGAPLGAQVPQDQLWFINAFPPVRMLEFALGIIMARIVLTGRWINVRVLPALALTVAAYALSLHVPWRFSLVATTIIPLALLIPAAAASDVKGAATVLRSRVLVWLGEVSFAFYMVHLFGIWLGTKVLDPSVPFTTGQTVEALVLYFSLALVLAWILHVAVEQPVMRRWSRPRRAAATVPVAAEGTQVAAAVAAAGAPERSG